VFIPRNCGRLIKSVTIYLIVLLNWITVVILELIHAKDPDFMERVRPYLQNQYWGATLSTW